MDGWGIAICIIGVAGYYVTKKKYPAFLFLGGVGLGIVIAAIWAMQIINNIF